MQDFVHQQAEVFTCSFEVFASLVLFFSFCPRVRAVLLEKVRRVWSSTRKVLASSVTKGALWILDFGPYRSCRSLSLSRVEIGMFAFVFCSRSAYLDFNASCDTWVKLATWKKWDRRLDRDLSWSDTAKFQGLKHDVSQNHRLLIL